MTIVYLNGQFIQEEKATISILDRGFLFGDGVYEAIPVYQGHLFGLQQHLNRLEISLAAIKIPSPLPSEEWEDILHELLVLNQTQHADQGLYLQITRGFQPVRNHAFPDMISPTVLAMCIPPKNTPLEVLHAGFSAITVEDKRRKECFIKATSLLPNILAYQEAHKSHHAEAIFIRNGEALEGTSSNLFIVKNGIIYTPPTTPFILAGVTRELLLQLAKENKVPYEEKSITENMLFNADEIWLTGSLKEIYPIVHLNNKPVGNNKVGPMWFTMKALYEKLKASGKSANIRKTQQPENRV